MILGLDEVLKRVKEDNLIENLGDRDLNNPEGVGLDLRLGTVNKIIEGGAFIGADGKTGLGKRKGVKTEEIAKFNQDSKRQAYFIVKPGEYYLVQTVEKVNTPQDLMPVIYTRSSLFRAGILLLNSKTDPGYSGILTMGLTNLSPFDVRIQLGARIANMVFFKIEGKTVSYRGQHQGGRVSPIEEERQV